MKIFQISGKGRSGKTTLANIIAKEVFNKGYIPVMIPFAKALKEQAQAMGYGKDTNPEEYRKFCQELGASKRAEDADYWVLKTYDLILEKMALELQYHEENRTHKEHVIIQDDVRYMNELGLGRELSAVQLFVYSCGRTLQENDAAWRKHESEALANKVELSFDNPNSQYEDIFDQIIDNSGTEKELEELVKENLDDWLSVANIEILGIDDDTNSNT